MRGYFYPGVAIIGPGTHYTYRGADGKYRSVEGIPVVGGARFDYVKDMPDEPWEFEDRPGVRPQASSVH